MSQYSRQQMGGGGRDEYMARLASAATATQDAMPPPLPVVQIDLASTASTARHQHTASGGSRQQQPPSRQSVLPRSSSMGGGGGHYGRSRGDGAHSLSRSPPHNGQTTFGNIGGDESSGPRTLSLETSRFGGSKATQQEIDTLRTLKSTVGVVMEVWGGDVGRLVTPDSIANPRMVIIFDRETFINGSKVGHNDHAFAQLTPGLQVDCAVQMEGATDENGRMVGLRYCSGIVFDEATNTRHQMVTEEEVMLLVKCGGAGRLAGRMLTIKQEMVVVLAQSLDHNDLMFRLVGGNDDRRDDVFTQLVPQLGDQPFMTKGRSVLVKSVKIPEFVASELARCENDASYTTAKRLALTIQPNGQTVQGRGEIIKIDVDGNGGTLKHLDEPSIGEVYFKFVVAAYTQQQKGNGGGNIQEKTKEDWPVGTVLLFEACLEFPGRQYQYRAFRLSDPSADSGASAAMVEAHSATAGPAVNRPSVSNQRQQPKEEPGSISQLSTVQAQSTSVLPPIEIEPITTNIDQLQGLIFDQILPESSGGGTALMEPTIAVNQTTAERTSIANAATNTTIVAAPMSLQSSQEETALNTSVDRHSVGSQTTRKRMKPRTYFDDRMAYSDQSESDDSDTDASENVPPADSMVDTPVKVVDAGGDGVESALLRLDAPATVRVGDDLRAVIQEAARQHSDFQSHFEPQTGTFVDLTNGASSNSPPIDHASESVTTAVKESTETILPSLQSAPQPTVEAAPAQKSLEDLLGSVALGSFFSGLAINKTTPLQPSLATPPVAPIACPSSGVSKAVKTASDSKTEKVVSKPAAKTKQVPVCLPNGEMVLVNEADAKRQHAASRQRTTAPAVVAEVSTGDSAAPPPAPPPDPFVSESTTTQTKDLRQTLFPEEFSFLYD